MTYLQADQNAQASWRAKVDETGLSRDAFALFVYHELSGAPDCWYVCFEELCRVHADKVTASGVVSVVRNGPITLRPVGLRRPCVFGPKPPPSQRTRAAVMLDNLQKLARLVGPRDGGDLACVQRDGPPLLITVDQIRYTHQSPADHFKDGRPIDQLVDELEQGSVHPLEVDFLVLDVVVLLVKET